jgi:hypothetical protein
MGPHGATALVEEPALGFWLGYAERQGALVEKAGNQALLVLPEHLQQAFELPEELTVTADPDLAREEGAALLTAGHPALERAATDVLAEGDAGSCWLPWPSSRPPARSALQDRARELMPVEHGRIDATGNPLPAYLPLLRVGAMIDYAASLTLRFGEQEESWVDAHTGLEVSEGVLKGALRQPRMPQPDVRHRVLPIDLPRAITAAHEQLQRRAESRQESLATQARRSLASELQRADAYYDAALESIERRRGSADADRLRMLDAQAEATRLERARRRREIEEELTARHEIKPFRLHLVHLPAFVLSVEVLRGQRRFPLTLAWLGLAEEFAHVRCPSCDAAQPLVAGKNTLGCTSCMPRAASRDISRPATPAASIPARARRGPAGAAERNSTPGASGTAAGAQPEPHRHLEPTGHIDPQRRSGGRQATQRPRPPAAVKAQGRRRAGRPPPTRTRTDTVERTGNKLALALWQQLARGERWPRKKLQRDSPALALYRLYGQAAPICALGIPPGLRPTEATASTYPDEAEARRSSRTGGPGFELTTGEVVAGGLAYPYALFWSQHADTPAIGELMPMPQPFILPPHAGATAEMHSRLHEGAPAPQVALDAVAGLLWETELRRSGLPFVARCLATWWRIQDAVEEMEPPAALAAAVVGGVARAAGSSHRHRDATAIYQADSDLVKQISRRLGIRLRLDRARGW